MTLEYNINYNGPMRNFNFNTLVEMLEAEEVRNISPEKKPKSLKIYKLSEV